jgi:hypothetical protein
MSKSKQLSGYVCVLMAGLSIYWMMQTPLIPVWQIVVYCFVMMFPVSLVLFWRPFDIYFGFAPPRSTAEDSWRSVTPWIGWLVLLAKILVNHFARPPSGL